MIAFPRVVVAAAVGFTLLQQLCKYISPILAPKSYAKQSQSNRFDWEGRLPSTVHAFLCVMIAGSEYFFPSGNLASDQIYGYSEGAALAISISLGFFVWDSLWCVYIKAETTFLMHGFGSFFVYVLIAHGFYLHMGCLYLLYEVSTIPLNLGNHLRALGMADSMLCKVSKLTFAITFISVRIIWGVPASLWWWVNHALPYWQVLPEDRPLVPVYVIVVLMVLNAFFNGLNVFWTYKIIMMMKRALLGAGRPGSPMRRVKSPEPQATKEE